MPHALRLFVFLAVAFLALAQAANADTVPKFKDYPASIYNGRNAPVRLDTAEERNFRTRLSEGAKQPVNFAGHFILVTWGCGSLCQTGAVINAKNGKVTFLPHTVCCWGEGETPFYYRANSRLLVLGGMLDEAEPPGAHFFEFDGSQFVLLKSAGAAKDEPIASSNSDGENSTVSVDEKINDVPNPSVPSRPNVQNLLSRGYRDVCIKSVRRIDIEVGSSNPPVTLIPDIGAYGETDWSGWSDISQAGAPVSVKCYFDTPKRPAATQSLFSMETACYLVDGAALCGPTSVIEPAAGPQATIPDEKDLSALSKALLFAVHRPVFNPGWESAMGSFGPPQADKLAKAFYVSSIKESLFINGSRYTLMYNVDADMFGMIKSDPSNKSISGLVSGKEISEKLFKIKTSDNFFVTALVTRPSVVRNLFHNYAMLNIPDEVFTLYQVNEAKSVAVSQQIIRYARLLAGYKYCRAEFNQAINRAEITYADGKASSEVGPMYLSVWSNIVDQVDGKPVLAGIAAFHDVKSNRYGGYLTFDQESKDCKITKVITNTF